MIPVGIRTAPGNPRELWQARSRRVKKERKHTATALMVWRAQKPPLPCSVLLTRIAPSGGLDDDNLRSALKGVRDEVAAWLGVNDRYSDRVRYLYAQRRGPWGVEIRFGEPASGAQLELGVERIEELAA